MQSIYQINPSYIFATMFVVFLLSLGVIFIGKKLFTWMAAGEELYTLQFEQRRQYAYRQAWALITLGVMLVTGGSTTNVKVNVSEQIYVLNSVVIAFGSCLILGGAIKALCNDTEKRR